MEEVILLSVVITGIIILTSVHVGTIFSSLQKRRKRDIQELFPMQTPLSIKQMEFLEEDLRHRHTSFGDLQSVYKAGELLDQLKVRNLPKDIVEDINKFYGFNEMKHDRVS